ncbi:hypothetical protein EVJ58_g5911 [Rhodofomes roseus]|uniref:F-box domain-containing protein n=1 Tax=Rhodofomes roseus TaxID=34475 RepID=A0A4Y9YAZ7_9APHY|nr:hypothetical protein EVJ58_g5911 [Rhodofomes roseus]
MEIENAYFRAMPNRRTTINDLPPDVLLLILYEVFQERLRYYRTGQHGDVLVPVSPHDKHVSDRSRCSAEYLASVCPLWRFSMSSRSIFWAQLVVWTGRDATPLSLIREYLEWSRERPLHIYVLRRFDPSTVDHAEKAHVKAIVELLLPHVKQWKVLSIKLLHSSSLPCPRFDLVGLAENLIQLNLDFIVDDVVSRSAETPSPVGEFETPLLEELSIGGVHFREAYMEAFPRSSIPLQLRRLALTGYMSPQVPFPLVDLLKALLTCKDLCALYLENIQLDVSVANTPFPHSSAWKWHVEIIDFIDISGDVIEEFHRLLRYPMSQLASYTRCSMPTREPSEPTDRGSFAAGLAEIASPGALLYYVTLVGHDVLEMTIKDSAGLQPEVLRALAKPTSPEGDDPYWLCPNLVELHITGCRQFRSADLRAALEARLIAHEATDFAIPDDPDFVLRSVEALYVHDCGELAPDDKEWFDKNVEHVRWDDWEGGSWRPMVS